MKYSEMSPAELRKEKKLLEEKYEEYKANREAMPDTLRSQIGVIVEATTDVVNDDVKVALANIAMQVAAMNPQYVSRNDISAEELALIDSYLNLI